MTRERTLAEEIAALNVMEWKVPVLPRKENDEAAKRFQYEGYEKDKDGKLIVPFAEIRADFVLRSAA